MQLWARRRHGHGLIAVAHAPRTTEEQVLAVLAQFEEPTLSTERIRYMTADGEVLSPRPGFQSPAHNFAPLSRAFSRFYVFSGAIFLTRSATSAAYIAFQLQRMGPRGEIIVQERSIVEERVRLSVEYLGGHFQSINITPAGPPQWFRLTATKTLRKELEQFPSKLPVFLLRSRRFRRAVKTALLRTDEAIARRRPTPEGRLIGQLGRLIPDSALFDKLLPHGSGGRPLTGLDVGGGFGFLACELAASGAETTIVDIDPLAMAAGPAMAKQCRVQDKVRFIFGSMVELPELVGTGPQFDFISFMGSLLLAPRQTVPGVLRHAMSLLLPGGLLIIKESPLERDRGRPESDTQRFGAEELRRYLVENAGEPTFYNAFTAREVSFEEARTDVLYAVVRKD